MKKTGMVDDSDSDHSFDYKSSDLVTVQDSESETTLVDELDKQFEPRRDEDPTHMNLIYRKIAFGTESEDNFFNQVNGTYLRQHGGMEESSECDCGAIGYNYEEFTFQGNDAFVNDGSPAFDENGVINDSYIKCASLQQSSHPEEHRSDSTTTLFPGCECQNPTMPPYGNDDSSRRRYGGVVGFYEPEKFERCDRHINLYETSTRYSVNEIYASQRNDMPPVDYIGDHFQPHFQTWCANRGHQWPEQRCPHHAAFQTDRDYYLKTNSNPHPYDFPDRLPAFPVNYNDLNISSSEQTITPRNVHNLCNVETNRRLNITLPYVTNYETTRSDEQQNRLVNPTNQSQLSTSEIFEGYNKVLPTINNLPSTSLDDCPLVQQVKTRDIKEWHCPITGCEMCITADNFMSHFVVDHINDLEDTIWRENRAIINFDSALYPGYMYTRCLALLAVQIKPSPPNKENKDLPKAFQNLAYHLPIIVMFCQASKRSSYSAASPGLECKSSSQLELYYVFSLLTTNYSKALSDRQILCEFSVYPADKSQRRTVQLPVIKMSEFFGISHLFEKHPGTCLAINFSTMCELTNNFTQTFCIDVIYMPQSNSTTVRAASK